MRLKFVVLAAAAAAIVFLSLFRVRIDVGFSLPREVERLDEAQEARFTVCVEERDRDIHRHAFGTIDNPDVQREVLIMEKEKAIAACRTEYPEIRETVSEPFRFNLVDLELRSW